MSDVKVRLDIDSLDASVLVRLLAREVTILEDMLSDADFEKERQEELLAEKAEIIKKLSENRNKVTPTKKPNPRKVGRPKGSKNKLKAKA